MSEEIFAIHVIDRSDPHDAIMVTNDHKPITRLELLKAGQILRNDIGLVTVRTKCPTCNAHTLTKQKEVIPTRSGRPIGNGWSYFSPAQQQELIAINQRMVTAALTYPEMGNLLFLEYVQKASLRRM